MKKVICLILFTLVLASLLAVNVLAITEQTNPKSIKSRVYYYEGIDAATYNMEYSTGGFWFWDDAEVQSCIQASFNLALSQMTAYSYSSIKNEYDGNNAKQSNREIHKTGRICETCASINDVYATYYTAIAQFSVDGEELFNAMMTP